MYSYEINELMERTGYVLTPDQYMEIVPQKCPQITRLVYNTATNTFHMYTNDGYQWEFQVRRD